MSKLAALREKRKELAAGVRQQADVMNADGYTPSAEDQAKWEKINGDYDATLKALEREEAVGRIEAAVAGPAGERFGSPVEHRSGRSGGSVSEYDRAVALGAWVKRQMGKRLTTEQQAACSATDIDPNEKEFIFNLLPTSATSDLQEVARANPGRGRLSALRSRFDHVDFRANLSNQSGPAGGYLIPPASLLREIEINLLAYGGLLEVADTITTQTGERMGWPTTDDTFNKGRRLGPNAATAPPGANTKEPKFGQVYLDAYKYTTDACLVPYELIEDAIVDVPKLLGSLLGVRLGRILNDECTTGTGNSMPMGIVTAAVLGGSTQIVKAGQIGADDILNLYHSVDPAYRVGDGIGFMMHDKILLQVRKLKDGDGQYLFKSGADYGKPDTLFGEQIFINQSMTQTQTSTDYPMIFGQLGKYKIRRVREMRMYRLEERYRDTDQDGFLALIRADGNLLTAGTPPVKALQGK
ncbi:phage major capsid protein [Fimbriiglobus ruber]|uniref:Phage major capsid protein n=1 Tax=Fimbriiglobus ruber TaxID=1908690 RepID=A0A225D023_9BACT|nr:phage major capsid protein [Fimbriiglobus ruber]OWK34960.1 Phage major capsid protein [Fimbriiglobus ruber]